MNQKLKILPPTLRDKKRYISFEVICQGHLNREDVISMVLDGSLYLHGSCGTAKSDIWVVKFFECPYKNNDDGANEHRMKGILRCRRGEVDSVTAVLPTITKFRGKSIVFHTLGISGTIKSATKNFIKL